MFEAEIAPLLDPSITAQQASGLLERIGKTIIMETVAPDVVVLHDTIAVEWLIPKQEWQPGQLTLCWGFEWIADVRQKNFRESPEF